MMGEPSIFKMKRRAEALAKILPVGECRAAALFWKKKSENEKEVFLLHIEETKLGQSTVLPRA
jgi:hypothetical protein